jgi:hypothetical protein
VVYRPGLVFKKTFVSQSLAIVGTPLRLTDSGDVMSRDIYVIFLHPECYSCTSEVKYAWELDNEVKSVWEFGNVQKIGTFVLPDFPGLEVRVVRPHIQRLWNATKS